MYSWTPGQPLPPPPGAGLHMHRCFMPRPAVKLPMRHCDMAATEIAAKTWCLSIRHAVCERGHAWSIPAQPHGILKHSALAWGPSRLPCQSHPGAEAGCVPASLKKAAGAAGSTVAGWLQWLVQGLQVHHPARHGCDSAQGQAEVQPCGASGPGEPAHDGAESV